MICLVSNKPGNISYSLLIGCPSVAFFLQLQKWPSKNVCHKNKWDIDATQAMT
jgi:hypothetical protein